MRETACRWCISGGSPVVELSRSTTSVTVGSRVSTGYGRILGRRIPVCVLLSLVAVVSVSANERLSDPAVAERPMNVHRDPDMGLEIWTEQIPEWQIERRYRGSKPVFVAQTPPNVYPPASMTVLSFAGLSVPTGEFEAIAAQALGTGLVQFGVDERARAGIIRERKRYGNLSGYEINFPATVHGTDSDVKVFIGRAEGRGPVLLQLYTLAGKMPHLKEAIRRSWTNIDYWSDDVQR